MNEQIEFVLGQRLELLNPLLRMHWAKYGRLIKDLAWEVSALVGPRRRPKSPWPRVSVLVERHSTVEPDNENLISCVKPLMDVLQPFHQKSRPYGLGIIQNDNRACVPDLQVRHVQSKLKQTRVVITRLEDVPPAA
jgi:hypothetical protein